MNIMGVVSGNAITPASSTTSLGCLVSQAVLLLCTYLPTYLWERSWCHMSTDLLCRVRKLASCLDGTSRLG